MTRGKIIIRSTGFIIQITSFENNKKNFQRGGGVVVEYFQAQKKTIKICLFILKMWVLCFSLNLSEDSSFC